MGTHLLELVQHDTLCGNNHVSILDADEFCKLGVLLFPDDVEIVVRDNVVSPMDIIIPVSLVISISIDWAL
jgi:hypothetical protein